MTSNTDEGMMRTARAINEAVQMLDSAMQLRNFSLVCTLTVSVVCFVCWWLSLLVGMYALEHNCFSVYSCASYASDRVCFYYIRRCARSQPV